VILTIYYIGKTRIFKRLRVFLPRLIEETPNLNEMTAQSVKWYVTWFD